MQQRGRYIKHRILLPIHPCFHLWLPPLPPLMSCEGQQQQRQHAQPAGQVLHTTDGRTVRSSASLGSEAPAGEASTVGLTGAPRGEAPAASNLGQQQGRRQGGACHAALCQVACLPAVPCQPSIQAAPMLACGTDTTRSARAHRSTLLPLVAHPPAALAGLPDSAITCLPPRLQALPLSRWRDMPGWPPAQEMWQPAMVWSAR